MKRLEKAAGITGFLLGSMTVLMISLIPFLSNFGLNVTRWTIGAFGFRLFQGDGEGWVTTLLTSFFSNAFINGLLSLSLLPVFVSGFSLILALIALIQRSQYSRKPGFLYMIAAILLYLFTFGAAIIPSICFFIAGSIAFFCFYQQKEVRTSLSQRTARKTPVSK
ncbi:hypothetical protein [Oceanobacillus timonensis]|uniref:hypothetical protein n=1 Tax=Oceanobacillus timonensis TaxID=1926285 RepID=UPI0009BA4344|nr:hypothetical protein [Oceanobacillus timonensis]